MSLGLGRVLEIVHDGMYRIVRGPLMTQTLVDRSILYWDPPIAFLVFLLYIFITC